MTEQWRDVPGLGGLYRVSSAGRVMGTRGFRKPSFDKDGYLTCLIWDGGRRVHWAIHRLVAEAFLGPCPEGCEVHHIDGDRANPAPRNLKYVTHAQNMAEADFSGAKNGRALLGEEQAAAIRASTEPGKTLSARYGISQSQVSLIRSGKRWVSKAAQPLQTTEPESDHCQTSGGEA